MCSTPISCLRVRGEWCIVINSYLINSKKNIVSTKKTNEWKKKLNRLKTQMHLEPIHLPRATAPAAAPATSAAAAVLVVVDDGGSL